MTAPVPCGDGSDDRPDHLGRWPAQERRPIVHQRHPLGEQIAAPVGSLHRIADRVRQRLFDDTDKAAAEALRSSVVATAQRSPAAVTKQTTGLTEDGLPVHSFQSLLVDLATLARNTIVTAITPNYPLTVSTRPTPIQHKAFALLGVPL